MSYKIVKIVDEYHVVVKYGSKDGAVPGEHLEIYQVGEEVIDPEAGESLGTLDFIKGKLKIKHVYNKMSLCESNEFVPNTTIATMINMGSAFGDRQKALNVNTEEISGGYDGNSKINMGDLVRIAVPEKKED
jgi:hypothetical protein